MSLAAREAERLGHRWLGSDHFLLALLSPAAEGSPAYEALRACSVDYDRVSEEVGRVQEAQGRPLENAEWSGILTNAEAHQVTAFASGLALGLGAEEVQSEHILLAILWQPELSANGVLGTIGPSAEEIAAELSRLGEVPSAPLPVPPAWRRMAWGERVVVPIGQTQGLISELSRLLPTGATFSFNHDGEKEAWFQATEGIDLPTYIEFALDAWERRRIGCPCCGYVALDVDVPLGERICPVCGWVDDAVQSNHRNYQRGPNDVSLLEAQDNFSRHGLSQKRAKGQVRPPRAEEIPPWRHEDNGLHTT
jgi:hypothetical protein